MTKDKKVQVKKNAYAVNDQLADEIRQTMKTHSAHHFNIMGSIGAGKTSLLEKLSEILSPHYNIFVINGDVATSIDADRIASHGATTTQIETHGGCHLNAKLVKKELDKINIDEYDLFFTENVGNLICPANWDVGAELNIVVISITEGPYVVKKHPIIFKGADIAIINKCDLKGIGFDIDELINDAKKVKSDMKVIPTSAKTGEGIDELLHHLGLIIPREV